MPIRRLSLVGAALIGVAACGDPPPGDTYFDHFIRPILVQNCNTTSGCHQVNTNNPTIASFGRAAGNLDVTSFEAISKRRDLLQNFGAYKYPGLLIKATAPTNIPLFGDGELTVDYKGEQLNLEVAHTGMGVLDPDSDAYLLIAEWIDNGATENGLKPPTPPQAGYGACSHAIPTGFDAPTAMAEPTFGQFRDNIQPLLGDQGHNCAAGNCHGAPQADFYITCGSNDQEVAFNYTQTRGFVGVPVEQSQVLNVPLARDAGGIGHTGGDQFDSRNDPDYVLIRDWAMAAGPRVFGTPGSPEEFFADNVQPIFLQRGCSFMNCHSPAATNDFKLRAGSQGFFSSLALEKNYDLFKREFMAVEFPDARQGRAVSKNLLPAAGGIRHRGGPVLETPGRNVDVVPCPGVFDPTFSPYCTIQEWLNRERTRLGAAVDNYNAPQIVYVDRPGGGSGDTVTEFNNFHGNSTLHLATFGVDAAGHIQPGPTANQDLTGAGACGGITGANADIRAPEVDPTGDFIAFAMRTAASGLQVWKYQISSGTCTQLTNTTTGAGITIDNFDPVWSPDGQWVVFASSRGGPEGPTHSRAPGFQPQSDIWRMHADGTAAEQVTFLSNSEIGPSFMREGRITMTTEKVYVDPEANQGTGVFHQLSGRRINWDRTDYHPLLAQRSVSPYADLTDLTQTLPTVSYTQATDIRERANGDFLIILSDVGANGGGGALAIFNRSAGTFETGRLGEDPGFLESVTMVALPGDTGLGRLTATKAYRGTFGLHDGQILTSYADLGGGTLDNANNIQWKLVSVSVNTTNGVATHTDLIAGGGAQMDAVEVVKRPVALAQFFLNRRQLVFGGQTDLNHTNTAYVHLPDAPMVFTLFTGNLRRGRPVDQFSAATAIEFWSENRNTGTTANNMGIYQDRTRLGKVDLMDDKSVRAEVPTQRGVVMKLVNDQGVVVSMGEEHQFGPGEEISLGIQRGLFDAACGGCHGSVSKSELDIATKPDVLTGASQSMAQGTAPITPQ